MRMPVDLRKQLYDVVLVITQSLNEGIFCRLRPPKRTEFFLKPISSKEFITSMTFLHRCHSHCTESKTRIVEGCDKVAINARMASMSS